MDGERIANAGLRVAPIKKERPPAGAVKYRVKRLLCANDIIKDFAQSIESFKCPIDPPPFNDAGFLRVASEQAPNRNSRVLLTEVRTDLDFAERLSIGERAMSIGAPSKSL